MPAEGRRIGRVREYRTGSYTGVTAGICRKTGQANGIEPSRHWLRTSRPATSRPVVCPLPGERLDDEPVRVGVQLREDPEDCEGGAIRAEDDAAHTNEGDSNRPPAEDPVETEVRERHLVVRFGRASSICVAWWSHHDAPALYRHRPGCRAVANIPRERRKPRLFATRRGATPTPGLAVLFDERPDITGAQDVCRDDDIRGRERRQRPRRNCFKQKPESLSRSTNGSGRDADLLNQECGFDPAAVGVRAFLFVRFLRLSSDRHSSSESPRDLPGRRVNADVAGV